MKLKEWISQYTNDYDHLSEERILDLDELFLSAKGITEIHPDLSNFRGRYLMLSMNKIKEIPEDFIQNTELYLNGNLIT